MRKTVKSLQSKSVETQVEQTNVDCLSYAFDEADRPMAKTSKIEPVNIELYEKAWAHLGRGVKVGKSRVQRRVKKQSSRKKKAARRRKTKKR